MNLFIVTIDTDDIESSARVISEIGEAYRVTTYAFLLKTTLNTAEVRDYMRDRGNAKRVFVSALSYDAAWANMSLASQTIKDLYAIL